MSDAVQVSIRRQYVGKLGKVAIHKRTRLHRAVSALERFGSFSTLRPAIHVFPAFSAAPGQHVQEKFSSNTKSLAKDEDYVTIRR